MSAQSTSLQAAELPTQNAQQKVPERAPANENAVPPVKSAGKSGFRRALLIGAAVALLAASSWYGWDYWTVGRFLVSTDDAYVKADNTTIAPKVSGYLSEVPVGDNERVKPGQ